MLRVVTCEMGLVNHDPTGVSLSHKRGSIQVKMVYILFYVEKKRVVRLSSKMRFPMHTATSSSTFFFSLQRGRHSIKTVHGIFLYIFHDL